MALLNYVDQCIRDIETRMDKLENDVNDVARLTNNRLADIPNTVQKLISGYVDGIVATMNKKPTKLPPDGEEGN